MDSDRKVQVEVHQSRSEYLYRWAVEINKVQQPYIYSLPRKTSFKAAEQEG